MTGSKPEMSNSKIFDVDTLAKQFAFLGVVLYIIGFLTTNLYLQQFGFSDFSPINPRFILTGSLVIFSVLFNVVFCLVAILMIWNSLFKDISDDLQTFQRQPKLFIKKIVIPFVLLSPISLLLSVLCLNIFFAFFSVSYSNLPAKIVSLYSLNFYIVGLLLGLIPLFPRLATLFKRKKININLRNNYLAIILILFYLELCGIYLGQFAKYIYPKVPEQFGGGEPKKVRVLFAKAQADALQKNGIFTCSSGNVLSNWSKPVSLLFEGSEKYLLRLEDKRPPIQLYKRNVDVVEPILETYNQKQKPIECPYTYTDKNIQKK